jgi:hypothetical protein
VLRASVTAESVGIPSVSLVCEGFVSQAAATALGLGFPGACLAVVAGHVDSQRAEDMIALFVANSVDAVIAGLVDSDAHQLVESVPEPEPRDIVLSGSEAFISHTFADQGWSDGLPIISPTIERVEQFLLHTPLGPDVSLGVAQPSGRELTVWSIAVNGVMAGCRPEQMPVLVALAEVIADPLYGVQHSGNTTGADALIIINGQSKTRLGFNHGPGALRDGYQANTSVGRWWRLYLRNVCGFTAGEHDKATFGNTFRVVLSEDEAVLADIGWPPFNARFGFAHGDDTVTVARYNSGFIIGSVYGSTPTEIVPYLADGLVRSASWELTHVYGLGQGQFRPLLVLSPMLARMIAAAGWTADDLRAELFSEARIPAHKFESYIGAWSNLTAGRRSLFDLVGFRKLPKVFAESNDPMRLVPIVTDPSCIDIAVAGDPFRANAFVLGNDGPHGFSTAKLMRST